MKTSIAIPVAATVGLALAIAAPLAASAHVTLDDNTADAGAYALLTFKVPNESATAATDQIVIDLPDGLSSVSYVPTPGWTATVTDSDVTWVADTDSAIGDGQLQLFRLSVGPVPDVDSVDFPVAQSYDDGSVVEWDGSGDHPAPTLYVNAEPPADEHGGAEVEAHDEADHADDASAASASSSAAAGSDVLARVLGILGLVVAAVALVLSVVSRRATR
jgi:uncharacterized protein YcnI